MPTAPKGQAQPKKWTTVREAFLAPETPKQRVVEPSATPRSDGTPEIHKTKGVTEPSTPGAPRRLSLASTMRSEPAKGHIGSISPGPSARLLLVASLMIAIMFVPFLGLLRVEESSQGHARPGARSEPPPDILIVDDEDEVPLDMRDSGRGWFDRHGVEFEYGGDRISAEEPVGTGYSDMLGSSRQYVEPTTATTVGTTKGPVTSIGYWDDNGNFQSYADAEDQRMGSKSALQ